MAPPMGLDLSAGIPSEWHMLFTDGPGNQNCRMLSEFAVLRLENQLLLEATVVVESMNPMSCIAHETETVMNSPQNADFFLPNKAVDLLKFSSRQTSHVSPSRRTQ
jgi:hypothetical protein